MQLGKEFSGSGDSEMYRKWMELRETSRIRKRRQEINSVEARRVRSEIRPPTGRLDLLSRPDMSVSSARTVLEEATRIDLDTVTLEYPLNKMGNVPLGEIQGAAVSLALSIVEKDGNPAVKTDDKRVSLRLAVRSDPDDPSIVDSVDIVEDWDADEFPMVSGIMFVAAMDTAQKEKDNLGYHFFWDRRSAEKPEAFVGPMDEVRLTSVRYKTLLVGRQWMFKAMLEWGNTKADFPKPVYPPGLSRFLMSFR